MTTGDAICPQMLDVWGGRDCWGEAAPIDNRWQVVLQSGCREGYELKKIWNKLQNEVQSAAEWLNTDINEVFAVKL